MPEIKKFLEGIFGNKPLTQYLLIWTMPDKKSAWFNDSTKAAEYVDTLPESMSVYVGCGASPKNYGPAARCRANDISGIPGLWVDIDYASAAHKKGNLPPTPEDALKLLEAAPVPPTIIINSGHGFHAWWLFETFWTFSNDEDRDRAASLCRRLQAQIRYMAKSHKWDVDSTADLARVLRVPGTYNVKTDSREAVSIHAYTPENRVDVADLEDTLPEDPGLERAKSGPINKDLQETIGAGLRLNPDAEPQATKLLTALDLDPQFLATWRMQREDMQDQSPSAYDMALANMAALLNWKDQEIADLLIAFRRHHGLNIGKALRPDYVVSTIAKAIKYAAKARAVETFCQAGKPNTKGDLSPEDKEALREHLSRLLNLKIFRVIRYVEDPPSYQINSELGDVFLGGIESLDYQNAFRRRVAEYTRHAIPSFKRNEWANILQGLLYAAEDEEICPESREWGLVRSWLETYLDMHMPSDNVSDQCKGKRPFIAEGLVCFFLDDLLQFLRVEQMHQITHKDLSRMLHRHGCENRKHNVYIDGKRTSRSVWSLVGDLASPYIHQYQTSSGSVT